LPAAGRAAQASINRRDCRSPYAHTTQDAVDRRSTPETQEGNLEGTMRKTIILTAAVAALGAAPAAFAADSACKLAGGWLGYYNGAASWVAVADGVSNSAGTITIDYPALDPTLFGAFPTGARVGIFRGAWERTGGRSFAYTTLAVAVDALGNSLWIGKLAGTETLGPDCNVEKITATFSAYAPNANPFTDVPFAVIPQADHFGYRIKAELPPK
jgi:hypothetical protein